MTPRGTRTQAVAPGAAGSGPPPAEGAPSRQGRLPGKALGSREQGASQVESGNPRPEGGEAAMDLEDMLRLKNMHMAPYFQMATALIGKRRRSGGNMFRHQIDTMAILIDYGYIDSVLLKASIIHDLLEDVPDFRRDIILETDEESPEVYKLVLEVTRRPIETKEEFLGRIREFGSERSRILKSADRISNMISLGYVTDVEFIKRYTDETENHVYPIAKLVDQGMLEELTELVTTRRDYLARCFEI